MADIYLLLIPIILTILFDLIGDFVNGVFSKPSKVYEEPKATSNIVVNVSGEQNVTIVNGHTIMKFYALTLRQGKRKQGMYIRTI